MIVGGGLFYEELAFGLGDVITVLEFDWATSVVVYFTEQEILLSVVCDRYPEISVMKQ